MIETRLEFHLKNSFLTVLSNLGHSEFPELSFQKTRKEFEGELTLVTFPLTKLFGKGPEQVGKLLGEAILAKDDSIDSFNVIKGFLNVKMKDSFWAEELSAMVKTENFGHGAANSLPLMMVEYSSPNTNKPLHLGHLRNNFLGWSVAEILKARGHKVKKVQIINDRGIHICKSMQAWIKEGKEQSPESMGVKGDKLVGHFYVQFDKAYKQEMSELIADGKTEDEAKEEAPSMIQARELLIKWEAGDKEVRALWAKMNSWVYAGFENTYTRMGVDFDKNYYESETYLLGRDMVMKGAKDGVFYQKEDGSVWVDLEPHGMDQKILLRSDGTAVYMTQDIGTAIMRFEENPGLASQIYTVGNEQDYHFKVLFLTLGILGYDWAKDCYHLSYGMVDLPTGKMKSREGTVVDADDLMEEMVHTAGVKTEELGKLEGMSESERTELFEMIGMGALKYFLLKVDPKKRMLFDPEESIDLQGNTAPFIQYSHARIKSIMSRFEGELGALKTDVNLHDSERNLILALSFFPQVIDEAASKYDPSSVANYTYDLVKTFNQFYQQVPILKESEDGLIQMRIHLIKATAGVVERGMKLLGIQVPDRM
jgi:arginyl-tRNA synthetase